MHFSKGEEKDTVFVDRGGPMCLSVAVFPRRPLAALAWSRILYFVGMWKKSDYERVRSISCTRKK